MKKILKIVLINISMIIMLILALYGYIIYVTEYKKNTRDIKNSQDSRYELFLKAVGEADWPFGSASGQLTLNEGENTISEVTFELYNDGKEINDSCWKVNWNDDYVEVILSGEEQFDEQILLYYDGRKERKQLTENREVVQEASIEEIDLRSYFGEINGCAVLYNSKNCKYSFYNKEMCDIEVSPYSTFKVVSALLGLKCSILRYEDTTMEYNGTQYPVEEWNQNLTLKEAFQTSCIWYFKQVIHSVGKPMVETELKRLQYGNCDISEWDGSQTNSFKDLNGFWINSSLIISPTEQIQVMEKIFESDSIYSSYDVQILKNIMLLQENEKSCIYGKTGSGMNGKAWFIGFKETEDERVYFAIYIDDEQNADVVSGNLAKDILFEMIKD